MTPTAAKARARGDRPSREELLRAILQREAAGLALNSKAVLRDDPRLHADLLWVLGPWNAVLRAAGLSPELIRRQRRWNRLAVVERIRQRFQEGLPINHGTISRSEPVLTSAAERYFPCWDDALRAAGLDPQRWRRRRPDWTRGRWIAALRERQELGGKVNHGAVGSGLSHAARRLFGSWDAALRAAGFSPEAVRAHRKPWTPEQIRQEIQRRHRAGEPLKATDAKGWGMLPAARRLFGSWEAALRAAGIDPATIRGLRVPWTRSEILAEIRRRHAVGDLLLAHSRSSGVAQAARKLFGSWKAALEAAGLDYTKIRRKRRGAQ